MSQKGQLAEWRVSGEKRETEGDSGKKVLGAASRGGVHTWLSGSVSPRDGTCSSIPEFP